MRAHRPSTRTLLLTLSALLSAGLYSPGVLAQEENNECLNWEMDVSTSFGDDGVTVHHLFVTAQATYDFNDSSSRQDAIREARLRAKQYFSEWQTSMVSSQDTMDEAINTQKKLAKGPDGSSKSVSKETIKTALTSIASQSATIQQGLMVLGSCHQWEGDEGRVVVRLVWSPKTSAAAQQANETMRENAAPTQYKNLPGAGGNTVSGGGSGSKKSETDF